MVFYIFLGIYCVCISFYILCYMVDMIFYNVICMNGNKLEYDYNVVCIVCEYDLCDICYKYQSMCDYILMWFCKDENNYQELLSR